MSYHPSYTWEIGDRGLGHWLIREDTREAGKWKLVMCYPVPEQSEAGEYDTPNEAASAVADFHTGNPMWDSLPMTLSFMKDHVRRTKPGNLETWRRHEN